MGRFKLRTDEQKEEFTRTYVLKEIGWGTLGEQENPFVEDYKLGCDEYFVNVSMFRECGLRLPPGPLLVNFFRKYHLTLGQLSPNAIRIICGIKKLNENHVTQLGLDELRYYYILTKKAYGYSLKARHDSPSLVLALLDSHKWFGSDAIILIGDIEPNPFYKPIPRLDKFDRPPEFSVKIKQINDVASDDSGNILNSQSLHLRAANQLLGTQEHEVLSPKWIGLAFGLGHSGLSDRRRPCLKSIRSRTLTTIGRGFTNSSRGTKGNTISSNVISVI